MTTTPDMERLEVKRLTLQAQLDNQKTSEDRNRMGQFATPTALAREIVAHGIQLLPNDEKIRFLDPGIGTGSFYSALRTIAPNERIASAAGFEIDRHYGEPAQALWKNTLLNIRIENFTHATPDNPGANLLICNPPYVRHHYIDSIQKVDLQYRTEKACGVKINRLSGLYCYFIGLAHGWMAQGGIAGWLIPSEFMSVNYGREIKRYLLEKATLRHIHRFNPEDVQFKDALVSSAIVWIQNSPPRKDHVVEFSYGGTLAAPALSRKIPASELIHDPKWTRYPQANKATQKVGITLGDLFDIKRGLATGNNSFFIMDRNKIEAHRLPMECFTPILPGSRYIPKDVIEVDQNGFPQIDKQLFLLNTHLPEREIAARYPALKAYLDTGKSGSKPVAGRYLCRSRNPWYSQENRPPAPILCTYMGRGNKENKPFRFILNDSQATACNVFLMLYPKHILARAAENNTGTIKTAWEFLNKIDPDELLSHGRVYGGGLHKLEPKELRGFPAKALAKQLDLAIPNFEQDN